jgi:hypothetical protein
MNDFGDDRRRGPEREQFEPGHGLPASNMLNALDHKPSTVFIDSCDLRDEWPLRTRRADPINAVGSIYPQDRTILCLCFLDQKRRFAAISSGCQRLPDQAECGSITDQIDAQRRKRRCDRDRMIGCLAVEL